MFTYGDAAKFALSSGRKLPSCKLEKMNNSCLATSFGRNGDSYWQQIGTLGSSLGSLPKGPWLCGENSDEPWLCGTSKTNFSPRGSRKIELVTSRGNLAEDTVVM